MITEVTDDDTLYGADSPKHMAEWVLRRTGPLTSSVAEVVAFVRTRAGLPAADIQFHMGAAYYEDHGQEEYDGHAIVIAPVLVSPKARGQVWLRSIDPAGQAAHHHQLAVGPPDDVQSLVDAMSLAREIASQGPLAEISVTGARSPGPRSPRARTSRPTSAGG